MADHKHLYPKIKEMYESGLPIIDISITLNISNYAIYKAISDMNIAKRKREDVLNRIEKGPEYVDNKVTLKKVVIDGKRYTDITPIFAPR